MRAYYNFENTPNEQIQSFNIDDFSGGLNNKTEVRDNQARDLLNMEFQSDLKIGKRLGVKPSNDLRYTTENVNINFIGEYKPYVGEGRIFTATDNAVRFHVTGNTYHDFIIPNVTGGVTYLNQFFFVDGVNIWVYDGTYARKMVNPPPGYTPLPLPATEGVWVNDDVAVPKERWYEPCQAEVDSLFTGENVIPLNPTIIATRDNRLYVSGSTTDANNVYISDIENGFYWPVILPLQPSPNGEVVTCLVEFMDAMIVGRNESIYAIFGNTNNTEFQDELFRLKKVQSHSGIANNKSATRMHNYLTFVGSDGVIYRMITPNTDLRYFTTAVLSEDIDLFKSPLNFTESEVNDAASYFFNNQLYVGIGDKTVVYNYTELAWTVYDIAMRCGYVDGYRELFAITSKWRNLYEYKLSSDADEPYSDAFNMWLLDSFTKSYFNVACYWTSKRFPFGSKTQYKHFREIFASISTYRDFESDVKINFEIDYAEVNTEINIIDRIAVWGRAVFGDRFIKSDIATSVPTYIGRRGRLLSFTIANDFRDQPIQIHEISGDYLLKGRRR